FAYGHYYLQLARPALPAPGETKSNVEFFRLLAERMGLDDDCFRDSDDDMLRTLLASEHSFVKGITLDQLDREHSVRLQIAGDGEPVLPFGHGGFATASGKCEFGAEALEYEPPIESRLGSFGKKLQYPLEIITGKAHDSMNSTFGNASWAQRETSVLQMSRS